jgi:hypothetical protein
MSSRESERERERICVQCINIANARADACMHPNKFNDINKTKWRVGEAS